jgi:hypothetical protein
VNRNPRWGLDGELYFVLTPDNVLFERALQVQAAQRFVYCEAEDFADAKRICDDDTELRDPTRARVEAVAFGRLVRPPTRPK